MALRIPINPLIDYIAKQGGEAFLGGMGLRSSDPDAGGVAWERTEAEETRFRLLHFNLWRARQRGSITLTLADEICCDYLGVHPSAVYGWDWFTFDGSQVDEPLRTKTIPADVQPQTREEVLPSIVKQVGDIVPTTRFGVLETA